MKYFLIRRRQGDKKEKLREIAISVCKLFTSYSDEVCSGIISINIDSIIYIVDSRPKLTATAVCSLLLQGECGKLDESLNFSIKISSSSSRKQSKSEFVDSNKIKILHFSDIHYDPNYLVAGMANCKDPCCCRMKQGFAVKNEDKAGYYGDYRNCDMPWHSVEDAIKSAARQHPDAEIIYYTGDFVDHGVWETTAKGNIQIMDRVNKLFKEVFGDKPVYSILGNHEGP